MTLRSFVFMLILTSFLVVKPLPSTSHIPYVKATPNFEPVFQKGMSYATYANMTLEAYSSVESDESLRRMRQIGVEWVAINIVGWYQTNSTSADINKNESQAPSEDDLVHVIQRAHNLSLKVMLKPMIDLKDGRWRGEIQPSDQWFQNYTNYINPFAEFAEQHDVEMFCIGTEYQLTTSWTQQWRNIINGVRSRFHEKITYAATYDEFPKISWWTDLDYAGLNAYYTLSNRNNPTIEEMREKFERDSANFNSWYAVNKIPIIFTEIGYLSVDGTNQDPSNYTLQYDSESERPTDLQEQAECYEATFQAVWNKSWFYGMYWWYWQTNSNAANAVYDKNYNKTVRDYTPQNKPAQGVITHWYSLNRGLVHPDYSPLIIAGLFLAAVMEAVIIGLLWRKLKYLSKPIPKG